LVFERFYKILSVFGILQVRSSTKLQEFALIRGEVEEIDKKLERAEADLNWESPREFGLILL
jgi:hypothetical protein